MKRTLSLGMILVLLVLVGASVWAENTPSTSSRKTIRGLPRSEYIQQILARQQNNPDDRTVAKISGGKDVITMTRLGNSLFVDVRLNHREQARFLLDTGCSETQISQRLAQRLGVLSSNNPKITAHIAGGKQVGARVVNLDELKLGKARVTNVRAVVLEAEGPAQYDGLLGMSFLNHFIFKIDSEKSKLVLQKRYKKTIVP